MPKSTNQKEQIVQAALKLFATRGYASTPISLIAKSAKVSQGLMYNFFKGKEDLLQEMMARGFEDIRRSMESYQQKNLPPQKAIELHINKTIEIIETHKEFWRLLHSIRLQGKVASSMKNSFAEIIGSVAVTFTKIFKALGYRKPEMEAVLFLAQIDGLVILYLQDNSVPIRQLAQHIIQRYKK
jgi:AcrR family transcriptional regulator